MIDIWGSYCTWLAGSWRIYSEFKEFTHPEYVKICQKKLEIYDDLDTDFSE